MSSRMHMTRLTVFSLKSLGIKTLYLSAERTIGDAFILTSQEKVSLWLTTLTGAKIVIGHPFPVIVPPYFFTKLSRCT